ncbi:hypothetical protein ROBYS_38510 [Roseobacter sp. OBYS 0001]|nr:hypothetical protein ROBYS_38510 [Roseobacter sp. OBYS 0001]
MGMRDLFVDQSPRHYAGDLPTVTEAPIGDRAHQADPATTVNKGKLLMSKVRAERSGLRGEDIPDT